MQPGFLPGIFFRGGKIYCYVSFYFYANFSIVFGPDSRGGGSLWGRGTTLGATPVEESQQRSPTFKVVLIILQKVKISQLYTPSHWLETELFNS